MDWVVDSNVPGAREVAEVELAAYLNRHLADAAATRASMERVRRALDGETVTPGRYWLTLDWDGDTSRLRIRPLPSAPGTDLPGSPLAAGISSWPWPSDDPSLVRPAGEGRSFDLGAERPAEASVDPDPGTTPLPADREGFLVGLAALAATSADGAPQAGCALAGARAGRQAEVDFRAAGHGDGPLDAGQMAEAFARYQEAIGGDFSVVEASTNEAVLVNRTCPFGAGAVTAPHLCRSTSAMLGSLAARNAGQASVSLDERIALGDPRCRLTLRLGDVHHPAAAHTYVSPPLGAAPVGTPEVVAVRGPEPGISLALQLPRDRLSVPVIRHLTRYALREVGVTDSVTHDIEVALAEACANVVEHAGPGDAYEVSIAIRADRCELRVVDTGHGFDHVSVRHEPVADHAERGRGLMLMYDLMDRVHFRSEPEQGTLVTLVKRLEFDDRAPTRSLWVRALRQRQSAGS